MKNKGITLVALVITIIILLILAGITISSVTNTGLFEKAKEARDKTANAAENQAKILNEYEDALNNYSQGIKKQSVEEITLNKTTLTLEIGQQETLIATIKPENASNKNIIWKSDNENIATVIDGKVTAVAEGKTTITVTAQDGSEINAICNIETKRKEFIFTKEFLQQGNIYGNVSITENNLNGTAGLTIIGYANVSTATPERPVSKQLRWYKDIDLTGINSLEFYAKKVVNHGSVYIFIDNEHILESSYGEMPTEWTKFKVDLSTYTGKHTLGIGGGYCDYTGNSESQTQFCDIKFIYE